MDEIEEGGGRAFWSGTVSFGLVSVPVDLLPAHTSARATLRMLDTDGTPLARRYYCTADDEEVDARHLARGREVDGKVVVVTDEELEALAPKKSREIDLRRFVDRDSIDPMYFERSYFLAPGKGSGKAYRLLAAVMERSRRAGIATFVMRDREYLVAIFAENGLLRGETLRFEEQVRSVRSVGLPKPARVDTAALKRMTHAVAALAKKGWDPSELSDPHEAIRELAQRKFAKGKDVIVAGGGATREEGGEIVDLMQVLRDSLAQNDLVSKSGRRAGRGAASRGGRNEASRSATSRSATSRSATSRRASKRTASPRSASARTASPKPSARKAAPKTRQTRPRSSAVAAGTTRRRSSARTSAKRVSAAARRR